MKKNIYTQALENCAGTEEPEFQVKGDKMIIRYKGREWDNLEDFFEAIDREQAHVR